MQRIRVSSGSPFEKRYGYSRAIRIGTRVLVGGTAPVWPDGSCDPDPAVQAARCLEIIGVALGDVGARPDQVVRTRIFIAEREYRDEVGEAHARFFGDAMPVATMVVAALIDPRWKVEIEAEADLGGAEREVRAP